jgi:hypothetical protein
VRTECTRHDRQRHQYRTHQEQRFHSPHVISSTNSLMPDIIRCEHTYHEKATAKTSILAVAILQIAQYSYSPPPPGRALYF